MWRAGEGDDLESARRREVHEAARRYEVRKERIFLFYRFASSLFIRYIVSFCYRFESYLFIHYIVSFCYRFASYLFIRYTVSSFQVRQASRVDELGFEEAQDPHLALLFLPQREALPIGRDDRVAER